MATEGETPVADSFEAAFDEIVASMAAGDKPAPVVEEKSAPVVDDKLAPVADDKPAPVVEEKPAPVVDDKPAPVVEEKPAPVATPAPALVAPVETPEAKAAREAIEASIAPYAPTEDEVKALEQFKKDFPNESVAVEARLKSVDRDINARVYKAVQEVLQTMNGRLTPVEQTVTTSAIEAHWSALHAAHSDYDTVITKVPDWIKTLPSYAQPGAQAVFDQGTTQDVIALVNDYKKSVGIVTTPAAPAVPTTPATPKPKPEGADDLAPVSSRRVDVTPKGTPDPSDFHGAFAEAVAAMGN